MFIDKGLQSVMDSYPYFILIKNLKMDAKQFLLCQPTCCLRS